MARAAFLELEASGASMDLLARADEKEQDAKKQYLQNYRQLDEARMRLKLLRDAEQISKSEKEKKAVNEILKQNKIDIDEIRASNEVEAAAANTVASAGSLGHSKALRGALHSGYNEAEQQLDDFSVLAARKQREKAEAEMLNAIKTRSASPHPSAPHKQEDPSI